MLQQEHFPGLPRRVRLGDAIVLDGRPRFLDETGGGWKKPEVTFSVHAHARQCTYQ